MQGLSRRQALLLGLAAPFISLASGCRASLPAWSGPGSGPDAWALLNRSAAAHGLTAFAAIDDVNVSYDGHWRRLVGKLQPALVDSGFRGGSEERYLLRDGVVAQSHAGPQGHKQVFKSSSHDRRIRVWFNDEEAHDRERLDAAALVVDGYSLFLFGPMLLVQNRHPQRTIQAALAGTSEVTQDKQKYLCDVVNVRMNPGIGNSEADQLALYIDHDTHLMRRVRMTLNGLESTRGALVDIDTFDHESLFGVMWPTAFHEQLKRPAPLDVHHWKLTGLDINRGESLADLRGPLFSDRARRPASPLPSHGPPVVKVHGS